MTTPLSATTPTGNAYGGGTLTPASNPVNVGGTFGGPGAASAPPNVSMPQILSARNNSGSNVRIPYARYATHPSTPALLSMPTCLCPARLARRLVPMHSKQRDWSDVPDIQMRGAGSDGGPLSGRPIGLEYDGLESGELAWIMGRKYLPSGTAEDGSFVGLAASAHGLGMGFGVDRMQRLAYTSWMEAYFRATFGERKISLNAIALNGTTQTFMSHELKKYEPYLTGATVLGSVDVPHTVNALFREGGPDNAPMLQYRGAVRQTQQGQLIVNPAEAVNVEDIRGGPKLSGLACGLFVAEKGPFLRGKVINDDAVDMIAPALRKRDGEKDGFHTVPRNMGDRLAFDALYAEMRAQNFFDWTPDGMVLSKLESPTGEPLSSAELDARQAQLFNVAIQGPAIAKTWTGDPRMHCMALDKVFVVMVADVSSTVDANGKAGVGAAGQLADAWKAYASWLRADARGPIPAAYSNAVSAANEAFETPAPAAAGAESDYATAVKTLFDKQANLAQKPAGAQRAKAEGEVQDARNAMDRFFGALDPNFDAIATQIKQAKKGISKSVMTNFRLMRVTSSFLAATSHTKVDASGKVDPMSRCGLPIGMRRVNTGTTAAPIETDIITGRYIIGGWCIGSVVDSAASRSSIGNTVKTAPASMAININVNVEWWSGDDLYKHYMDVGGTVFQRGGQATAGQEPMRKAKLDVGGANLEEFKSWESKE